MRDIIIYVMVFMITLPVISTLLVYLITNKVIPHKMRAFHVAMDWTTLLYIMATINLFFVVFERSFFSIILGILLLVLITVIIYQWKTKTEIVFQKAFKISWRIYFLFFFFLYFLLLLFGILQRIIFY